MRPWKDAFVAWDVETTGLDERARIIEIATAAFSRGSMIATASCLFDPCLDDEEWASPDVQKALSVNGITRRECCDAPRLTSSDVMRLFGRSHPRREPAFPRLGGSVVYVGHNVRFDLRVLQEENARLMASGPFTPDNMVISDFVAEEQHLCTIGLDLVLRPNAEGHSLAATCERWGVEHGTLHRALADVQAVGRLLLRMAPELPHDLDHVLEMQRDALMIADARRARRHRA